ncbi:hypothetical protein AGMMS50249_7830 [candidate division SR1 bacterium]|nr:hypothetical protein AGMMS50249_7830 [candidate division SR1 bacterium]
MEPIISTLRRSLSQHYRGNKMIGTIAMQVVKSYFGIEKVAEGQVRLREEIDGYVRNNKLLLKTDSQGLKITIFKEKRKLIDAVNVQLSNMGYKVQIEDVILK